MKRHVFLGVAAIAALALAAAAVMVMLAPGLDRDPVAAGPAATPAAVAPPEASTEPPPVQAPPGRPHHQLSPAVVARDLTAPVAPCHRVNAVGLPPPAVLTLELEAGAGGGLVVVGASVASQGGASEGLVSCASEVLLGRQVTEGSFSAGERFLVRFELVPPAQGASPPPEPSSRPASASVTRQQLRHRGGAR
jgi:hypothetical protein